MGRTKKEKQRDKAEHAAKERNGHTQEPATSTAAAEPLTGKAYEKELRKLHVELVKLQEWVKHKGLKVVVVFEGRDGAGKGGTIKAITERVSPRVFRVVALPAPNEREQSQMYMQRYVRHMPAAGEDAGNEDARNQDARNEDARNEDEGEGVSARAAAAARRTRRDAGMGEGDRSEALHRVRGP